MSLIVRTAGIGRTIEELTWDMNYLLQLWEAISNAKQMQPGAYLIYQESSLVIRQSEIISIPILGNLSRHRRNFRTGSPVYATCYARYGGQGKKV